MITCYFWSSEFRSFVPDVVWKVSWAFHLHVSQTDMELNFWPILGSLGRSVIFIVWWKSRGNPRLYAFHSASYDSVNWVAGISSWLWFSSATTLLTLMTLILFGAHRQWAFSLTVLDTVRSLLFTKWWEIEAQSAYLKQIRTSLGVDWRRHLHLQEWERFCALFNTTPWISDRAKHLDSTARANFQILHNDCRTSFRDWEHPVVGCYPLVNRAWLSAFVVCCALCCSAHVRNEWGLM